MAVSKIILQAIARNGSNVPLGGVSTVWLSWKPDSYRVQQFIQSDYRPGEGHGNVVSGAARDDAPERPGAIFGEVEGLRKSSASVGNSDSGSGKRVGIAVAMCNVAEARQNTYPVSALGDPTCPKCSDQSYIRQRSINHQCDFRVS